MDFYKAVLWWLTFALPPVWVWFDGFKQISDLRSAYELACQGQYGVAPCGGVDAILDHLGVFVVVSAALSMVVTYHVAWALVGPRKKPN